MSDTTVELKPLKLLGVLVSNFSDKVPVISWDLPLKCE